jgi:hypothetical protein
MPMSTTEYVRWALILFLVLSNVAVWLGVYLESDQFTKATQQTGWRILLCGLAAETAIGFLIAAVDWRITQEQAWQIAALNAKANEAELRIAAIHAPRSVAPDVLVKYLSSTFPQIVTVKYVANCSDCLILSATLFYAFKNIKWDTKMGIISKDDVAQSPFSEFKDTTPIATMLFGRPNGVTIVAHRVTDGGIKNMVVDDLKAALMPSLGPELFESNNPSLGDNQFVVVVAPRF